MNSNKYIILNGDLIAGNKPVFTVENRSFRFGDALFETIRYHKGIPLLFDDHYNRLLQGMITLKMNIHSLPSIDRLKELFNNLITKNCIYKDARIRLTIFRKDGGLYTPENNNISYTIEATPIGDELYFLNKKGLLIGIFHQHKKTISPLYNFKNANSLLYVLAGIYKKEFQLDDCLIVNENDKIIEGLSSNLFWIKGRTVFTPFISTGCIDGIMRKQVFNAVKNTGMNIQEVNGTSVDELTNADEIFLTNAIQGIRWVMGLENKRFYNFITKKIFQTMIDNVQLMIDD